MVDLLDEEFEGNSDVGLYRLGAIDIRWCILTSFTAKLTTKL